ncbi:GerAB/ArcD/ProY family transporter [Paenibacillus soyae]|uniref:Spore germination protein n=1 Tax=Paenibacillus soyae TaxID=2969249 RepID=A0A9X2MQL2_9BACL|nr:spore germination protein [Paenibacillus soyae]MCR2804600.1 spore germination protein [Paenibacillus soyae]
MNKEWISHVQAGVLFFVFMTGSSIINIPGPLIAKAGNGAWISLLLSGAWGFGVLAMLLYLFRRFPDLCYVDYSRKLIGKLLTLLFGLMALTFLFQMLSAIVMDVGLFMVTSMLRETPVYAFTSLILLTSALTARAGIEVIARMFMIIMLFSVFFISITLILAIPDYHPEFLQPVVPKGWNPVLHGAYFTFGFPYAEVFVFGMLMHHVAKGDRKKLPASMLISLGLNLITLMVSALCSIMIFGPYAGDLPYVLFSVARLVEFQEIIQRIESIIGMSLILGSYMKATITLYVICLFIGRLFGMEDGTALALPVAFFCFLMGLVTFDGPAAWGMIVTAVHPLWAFTVFFLPLLTLTAVAAIRRKV